MSDHTPLWLVVKTKPRQEVRAKENLERQGFLVYLPRLPVKKRLSGIWRVVFEPLFPGYLFITINPEEKSLAPIRSTFGVIDLVKFGQQVVPVPAEVISYIQQRESDAIDYPPDTLPLSPGDEVKVLDGPFAGLPAIYQMAKGSERAMLLISFLGRHNSVAVPINHIAPVG